VRLLIVLLVPEQATQQHLEVLSEFAQLLSDRPLREQLFSHADAGTVHSLIVQWQPLP
jgi:PTS system nitrogen regulatory IIA component